MKWLIASDIHGSAYYCEKLLQRFYREKAERLLLLGDILYHGPRNALPEQYDPPRVAEMLNGLYGSVVSVRGNCEAEVDQMMLRFPVMADYALLDWGQVFVFATHGHLYHEKKLPPLKQGDILLHGHTHVPDCRFHGEPSDDSYYIYMNPGSVSIPKEGSYHGYMSYEDGHFQWKDFDGELRWEYRVP